MIHGVRAALCLAVVCLVACGGGGSGSIGGKVTFTDGSDATGLPVTLLGPTGKRLETGAGGAYNFDKLPKGVYQVSVEGKDTREGRLSFGTESDGSAAIMAPDLSFTPIASVTGKVMNAAGPAAGVTVYLSGSDRVSLTDAAGSFGFFDVPTGTYSLVAKASGTIAQTASAVVMLKRGKNEAMPLTLGNDLTVTGKIQGTLALFNGASPLGIKVSVADISAMTADSGAFTLTLPPGEYEVIAELTGGYTKQSLGFVTVRAGQTTTIPVKTLTLFKAFPWASSINSASIVAVSEGDTALMQVNVNTDYFSEHYFVNTSTFERRLYAIGGISSQCLSKNGKWVAFNSAGRAVIAINSATGQTHAFAAPSVLEGPVISNDESTMMYFAGAPQNALVRVDLNTGSSTNFIAYPGSYFQTNERFLARTAAAAPFDVFLITPTTDTKVFANMQVLSPSLPTALSVGTTGYQVMVAYNCPALGNCSVQILGPSASNSSAIAATIGNAPSPIFGSVKDWVGLQWSIPAPTRVLIKVADGTATPLPANAQQLLFNETQSRVVTYALSVGNYEVREDLVPPNPTSTVHLTTPTFPQGAWISPTRFMVFGSGTTKRVDLKAGVATSDNDVTIDSVAASPLLFAPGALWIKATTMKRVAAVYDSTEIPAPDTLGIALQRPQLEPRQVRCLLRRGDDVRARRREAGIEEGRRWYVQQQHRPLRPHRSLQGPTGGRHRAAVLRERAAAESLRAGADDFDVQRHGVAAEREDVRAGNQSRGSEKRPLPRRHPVKNP
jgi:hypothetical protein